MPSRSTINNAKIVGDSETAEESVTQQNGILKIDKADKGNKLKKTNWSLILIYIILGLYACDVVG